jgi:hypothetical protein
VVVAQVRGKRLLTSDEVRKELGGIVWCEGAQGEAELANAIDVGEELGNSELSDVWQNGKIIVGDNVCRVCKKCGELQSWSVS